MPAKTGKMGLFEVANHGTIFLDEIGELPLDMQVKLLRVLQDQQVTRIGGTEPVKIDVRILAATNRDLLDMVEHKQFRQDLYYRLNIVPIHIPPLRERRNDIIPLAKRFLDGLNQKYHFEKKLSNLAYQFLTEYSWPGNVRELKNVIEQAVIMSEDNLISLDDLPLIGYGKTRTFQPDENVNLKEVLEQIEYEYISRAYNHHNSVRQAARSLHMNYSTFERKRMYYAEKYPGQLHAKKEPRNTGFLRLQVPAAGRFCDTFLSRRSASTFHFHLLTLILQFFPFLIHMFLGSLQHPFVAGFEAVPESAL